MSFISIKKYLELVKFSHTIFAMPFALGTFAVATGAHIDHWKLLIIIVCMVTARNAAMAFNRAIDSDLDSKNPRTEGRHIPSGQIKKAEVTLFILANSAIFIASTYFLNSLSFYFSGPMLLFLFSYSYWKRFSWLCHLFLGLAIGSSPLAVWVGLRGEVHLFPILLGLVLALWVAGFDIIYATQDYEFDKQHGLHSAVVYLGIKGALYASLIFHLLMLATMWLLYITYLTDIFWLITTIITVITLLYIHFFNKNRSLDALNSSFFKANALISILVFGALLSYTYISNGEIL